ncbi:MAG: prenyltransferase [Thermoplasmata archaeon]|nr:prenyltransferase [Candidatus Sysuiplasma acidicola]MBX8646451.1 prenyltransferase [Candidatus Sysuiplasma acidicola]MDH2905762.1 prenyltransferase [Methanomassiliicoccales archaeon]
MNVRTIVSGLRFPLYWASGGPIVISAALAIYMHDFTHPQFWATGSLALFVFEIGVNLLAEVSDGMEGVTVTQSETWIPTGPYLMEKSGLPPKKLLMYGAACFALSGIMGLYLASVTGFAVILSLGVAGMIMTYVYAFPPAELGFRGVGEPVPFLAFGPLPVVALFYLSTGGALTPLPLLFSLPTAFWITAVRYAHHLPDEGHRRAKRYRKVYGARLAHAVPVLTLLMGLAIVSTSILYPFTGIGVFLPLSMSILLSLNIVRLLRECALNPICISRLTRHFVALQFIGTLLIALALLVHL